MTGGEEAVQVKERVQPTDPVFWSGSRVPALVTRPGIWSLSKWRGEGRGRRPGLEARARGLGERARVYRARDLGEGARVYRARGPGQGGRVDRARVYRAREQIL